MNDKEFADAVHMEIHAVRRIAKYKPNPMEVNISRLVLKRFQDTCEECKEMGEKIKNTPVKKGFFDKLKGAMNE